VAKAYYRFDANYCCRRGRKNNLLEDMTTGAGAKTPALKLLVILYSHFFCKRLDPIKHYSLDLVFW
tara:strand:+ start:86 stop:283 length:198 start_codon:yes stop_codon:yes gene_type:complete